MLGGDGIEAHSLCLLLGLRTPGKPRLEKEE